MRILHVPTDCGNHGPLLARIERSHGHDSWSIVFAQSYLGYKADEVFGGRGLKAMMKLEFTRWKVLFRALSYDVIFYNYGSSIAPNPVFVGLGLTSAYGPFSRLAYTLYSLLPQMWDVVILRLLGKRILVVFQGGDARQGRFLRSRGGCPNDWQEEPRGYYTWLTDTIKRVRAKLWDLLAHEIYYLNPDLAWVLPKRAKYLPYPMEVKNMELRPIDLTKTRITFGHVVNHREPKGTRFVLDAVHKLRMSGKDFGFLFGERLSHEAAMRIYDEVDVILEQFVIGWYGLQAVEFMAKGRPVIVFINQDDYVKVVGEGHNLTDHPLPFVICDHPHDLANIMSWMCGLSRSELREIGLKCREYVLEHHDVEKISRDLEKDYGVQTL